MNNYTENELAELVPEYLKNRKLELAELGKLLEASNFKKMETIGHRLKGNAKSYGFEDLGKLGARLELASKEKNSTQAFEVITEMEKFLNGAISKNLT